MPKKTTQGSQLALFNELNVDPNESKNVPDGIIRDQLGGYYDEARGAYIGADGTIFGQRPLFYYSVQIEGWGSPMIHKGWSPEDVEQLASITWIKNIKAGAEARIKATLLDRPPLIPPAPKYLPGPPERAPQIDEEGPVKKKPVHITSGAEPRRRRGRPSLAISPERIIEALERCEGIAGAADSLGCSRPYIYKVIGTARVKKIIGGKKK